MIRAIEETRIQTLQAFEEKTQRRIKSRWQKTKQALMDALGHRPTLSTFGSVSIQSRLLCKIFIGGFETVCVDSASS